MKRLTVLLSVLAVLVAVGAIAVAGERATPEEAKALLDRAVKLVETEGEAKALAEFNDPEGPFVDRDLYVFCYGPDHKISAHPKLVGKEIAALKDPEGKEIGKEFLALGAKGEGTLEYKWENPLTGKVEPKVSFVKTAGKQVCGVGAYK